MALKLKPIKEIVSKELEKNNILNNDSKMEDNINKIDGPQVINKTLFLLFAEFIGYVSDFVKYADDVCAGKEIPKVIHKLIELDADYIFRKMQEEYTIEEIKGWYNEFYPLILKEYEDAIKEKENKELVTTTTDLPY